MSAYQSPQIWAKPPHLSFCVNHSFENVGLNTAASTHPLLCNLFCLWMVFVFVFVKWKVSNGEATGRGRLVETTLGELLLHSTMAPPIIPISSSLPFSVWAFNLRIFMIHRRSSKHRQKLVFKSCEGLLEETTLLPYLTLCNIGRYRPHIFSQSGGRCRPNLVKV